MLILKDAARVRLPGMRMNVVARIRTDFEKHGYCDHALIQKVEEALRKRLAQWSLEEKRGIWESIPELSQGGDHAFDSYTEDSIEMNLESELLSLITDELSPLRKRFARHDDE